MMLEEMALDGVDARDVAWDDVPPDAAGPSASSSSAPACRACSRRSGSSRPASPTSSSRRTTASAAPGSRTPIPAAASTSRTTSTATRSRRTTTGRSSSRSRDELQRLLRALRRPATASRDKIRFGTEVVAARFDETRRDVGRARPRRRRAARRRSSANARHQRRRPAQPAEAPRHPRARAVRRAGLPLGAWQHDIDLAGKRVAVIGTGASAFQLVPEVAKQAARLLVFQRSAAVDGAEPALPRARQRGEEVAAAARARTTRAGTASCSSGRGRTASCRRSWSIPSGRTRSARSTR